MERCDENVRYFDDIEYKRRILYCCSCGCVISKTYTLIYCGNKCFNCYYLPKTRQEIKDITQINKN